MTGKASLISLFDHSEEDNMLREVKKPKRVDRLLIDSGIGIAKEVRSDRVPSQGFFERRWNLPAHDIAKNFVILDESGKLVFMAEATNDPAQDQIKPRILCWVDQIM